jgi:hypothetical protein
VRVSGYVPHLVLHHRLTPNQSGLGTVEHMSRPEQLPRRRRLLVALLLVALAIVIVVAEPFPKGDVLLKLSPNHGIDIGDLPALALLLVAALLAL